VSDLPLYYNFKENHKIILRHYDEDVEETPFHDIMFA
jgi:hypothetical protein